MDQFLNLLVLKYIVLEGGGNIHQGHPSLDTVFEIDIFIQVLSRPEVHQLHCVIHAPDAVDASESLDDADRIPVDIVVDQIIAVLKVLAFGNAVRRDQKIDLGCLGHGRNLFPLLGPR